MKGNHVHKEIDEQIVYNQLDINDEAVWSLLLASGYLKVVSVKYSEEVGDEIYEFALTNAEVKLMFKTMIKQWFKHKNSNYNEFINRKNLL